MKVPRSPDAKPSTPQIDLAWLQMAAAQMFRQEQDTALARSNKRVRDNPETWWNTEDRNKKTKGPVAVPGEQIADPAGLGRDVRID